MSLINVEKTITLDVYDHDTTPSVVKTIQLDTGTRTVFAVIQNSRQDYDIGQNASVSLTVLRPDKTRVQITGEPYPIAETTVDGETITYYGARADLTQLLLAVKGNLKAQFKITSGEQELRTEIFAINNGEALDAGDGDWAGDLDGHNLDEMAQDIEDAKAAVSEMETDVSELKEELSEMQTATAEDVGKALKAKTVTNGKVTEWEFGEAGGNIDFVNPVTNYDTLKDYNPSSGGTHNIPCEIASGQKIRLTVTTLGNALTIRLKNGDTVIDTVIANNSHVATENEVFDVVASGDCDTILLYTKSKFTLLVQSVKDISGDLEKDGYPVIINAEQISDLDATRNYELEAYSMKPHHGKMMVGLYLDCGRKYYTQASVFSILSNMATAGFNALYLHFSENEGFRFGLDDMSISANGTTYDLSVALGKGIYAYANPEDNDNYITQTEMTAIVAQAKSLGIEIIPCLDMPAHMGAILEHFTEFQSSVNKVLNIKKSTAVNFALAIVDKYAEYFESIGCKCWNIGADEITAYDFATDTEAAEAFVDFCNRVAKLVIRHGMLPMMFNDNVGQTNIADRINRGSVVLFWSTKNGVTASDVADLGYRIINMSNVAYYSPGSTNPTISNFNLYYPSGTSASPVDNPCPIGGNLSFWYSQANNTDYGKNDGGTWMVENSAQYIADFGALMKVQKKSVTKSLQEAITIPAGGMAYIGVNITGRLTVKKLLGASVVKNANLKYIGFANDSCETDPITSALKNGMINVVMLNIGSSDVSLTTNNSISIEFL